MRQRPAISSEQQVRELLTSLFSDSEFKMFVAEQYPQLAPRINWKAPLNEQAFEFITLLHRHGLDDSELYERLYAARPDRSAAIAAALLVDDVVRVAGNDAQHELGRSMAIRDKRRVSSRIDLRRRIEEKLVSDSDLNAFCGDYFPGVYRRFTNGMDRVSKVTLLLDHADLAAIERSLDEREAVVHSSSGEIS